MTETLAKYGPTAALTRGTLAGVGFVFLMLFFALKAPALLEPGELETFAPLGRTNHALIGLSALAAIPVAFRFHRDWRARAAALSGATLIIGVSAMLWMGLIQLPYAVGLISSTIQGSFIQFGLVITESPLLLLGFVAGLISSQIGYPIWAIWLGRRLQPLG